MNNMYINFDPVAISLGPFFIYWYGILYAVGFIYSLKTAKIRRKNLCFYWETKEMEKFFYIGFICILIGGRIGYIIFYKPTFFIANPIWIFKIWTGGMSFHGGFIGILIFISIYSKKMNIKFFYISDFIAPLIPLGIGLGRLGNFINGELWGKVTLNTKFFCFFPKSIYDDIKIIEKNNSLIPIFEKYGSLPRHPSQLYEMFLEGFLLFIILNVFVKKHVRHGVISGIFLIFYGLLRIISELFRQEDSQIGLIFDKISMGQLLSFPMIFFGLTLLVFTKKKIF
ncbi:prolipoprotein diacylglyceryl transferase [Candidatus Riesia sp. GBBU]|nr:prolipoprotein diacylglyceryl transferase [Candidatus Riesia sp. GBBU]